MASVNRTVAKVDKSEAAHFSKKKFATEVKAAKHRNEDALREKFFGF